MLGGKLVRVNEEVLDRSTGRVTREISQLLFDSLSMATVSAKWTNEKAQCQVYLRNLGYIKFIKILSHSLSNLF